MAVTVHPVILCGGSGTRLWPLSSAERPKQFLTLTSERSLLGETAYRFRESQIAGLAFSDPLVVGAERHAALLNDTLPGSRKILEPFGRNSAPAIAAACLAYDPDDMLLILPADHDIKDIAAFHSAILSAADAAAGDSIVTFGINPTYAATGYGYIHAGNGTDGHVRDVDQFVEKPDLKTAEAYVADGSYFWNAGIFLFRARTMIQELNRFAPEVMAGSKSALVNVGEPTMQLTPEAFAKVPDVSIDYAVMESADNIKTVPVSMGWSDIGGYRALHELMTESPDENYQRGRIFIQNSSGVYARSEGPALYLNGVDNLIVVATPNEIMITSSIDDAAAKALGAAAKNTRHTLGLSSEVVARAKNWLWQAFDAWSRSAWDHQNGGFVEQLNLDGIPDTTANRRVRVQARQIFSFSKAVSLGWPNLKASKSLVENGLDYLDSQLRHPDGGWVHIVDSDAAVVDAKRDLYDHAFIILAGTAAFSALDSKKGLKLAEEAIAFIDRELLDESGDGWAESLPASLPRRANPHMHLLEAMLAFHKATGCAEALAKAKHIVDLFETRFFNPRTNVMAEQFTQELQPTEAENVLVFEPGHHFEWASLLWAFEQLTGHDSLSWRRRLMKTAEQLGRNAKTGLVLNYARSDDISLGSTSRLWPQLEMLRAYLLHAPFIDPQATELAFKMIEDYFRAGAVYGLYIDQVDADGIPNAAAIPASMLYHLVTAFEPLLSAP
ncbi:MAG: AGE family epimerase/isomerase [Pseudomonadota bacterium]